MFIIFGGLAALVNLSIGKLLYDVYDVLLPYAIDVLISTTCGLFVNFICCYLFIFTTHSRSFIQHFITFLCISIFGVLLTAIMSFAILYIFEILKIINIRIFGILFTTKFSAHFCAVGLVAFYSFYSHKYISFQDGLIKSLKIIYKNTVQQIKDKNNDG
jgi:putative flippase GtrA